MLSLIDTSMACRIETFLTFVPFLNNVHNGSILSLTTPRVEGQEVPGVAEGEWKY